MRTFHKQIIQISLVQVNFQATLNQDLLIKSFQIKFRHFSISFSYYFYSVFS
jgi:hypothetical protein